MRIWREATERGGGAAGRRFSRIIIFVYLLLRKLFTFARPRASGPRARAGSRGTRHAARARLRLAVTRLYPTDDRVSCASQTTHTFRVLRPETGVSVLRAQTSDDLYTHTRQASQDIHKSAVQTEKPPCLALEACGRITHLQPSVPPTPPYVAAHQHRWSRYNHSANA